MTARAATPSTTHATLPPRAPARDPLEVVTLPVGHLLALIETAAERGAERALSGALGARTEDAGPSSLVDSATVARDLAHGEQWVREHARELGGSQARPRAPWRFDLTLARERFAAMACCDSRQSQAPNPNAGAGSEPSRRRRARRMPNGMPPNPPVGSILRSRPREGVEA